MQYNFGTKMIKHKILIKANMAIALCIAIAFAGYNQDAIIPVADQITAHDLQMEKAQIIVNFNKERYETLKDLHGEENKETKKAALNWKISVLDIKILKLDNN